VAIGEDDVAGASARRAHARRQASWESTLRQKHRFLGGALVAIREEPQHVHAWSTGAIGEEAVGRQLNRLRKHGIVVLHDRLQPGARRANVDHVVVAPSGVWVVDAKCYRGKTIATRGNRKSRALFIGGRDRTPLVDAALKQRATLAPIVAPLGIPVRAALCFVAAEWPTFLDPTAVNGVLVGSPGTVRRIIGRRGPLTAEAIASAAAVIDAACRPAA
jgi:hypothetical protein